MASKALYNPSILLSTPPFPYTWRHACVKPIHKGSERGCPSNYGPISILPVSSNVLEHCAKEQLCQHLSENKLHYPLQNVFHAGHSTATTLLYCLKAWYHAVVFLDIPKSLTLWTITSLLGSSTVLALLHLQ